MSRLPNRSQSNRIATFLSHNVWTGIGVLIAIIGIAIPIYFFYIDREQKTANIEYWYFDSPFSMRLPSGKMSEPSANTLFVGMRNNGPSTGEGVLVSVSSGAEIDCKEIGAGLNFAETQTPTRVTTEPFLCEYYYEYLYPEYHLFFLIDRSSKIYALSINITGKNVKVSDVSENRP